MRKLARKTTSTHRNAKSQDPRDHRLHRHSSSDIKDKSLSFELAAFPNTFPHLLAVKEASERASGGFVRLCSCNPLCGVTRYKSEKASPPVGRTEIPGKADLFGFVPSRLILALRLLLCTRLYLSPPFASGSLPGMFVGCVYW